MVSPSVSVALASRLHAPNTKKLHYGHLRIMGGGGRPKPNYRLKEGGHLPFSGLGRRVLEEIFILQYIFPPRPPSEIMTGLKDRWPFLHVNDNFISNITSVVSVIHFSWFI